MEGPTLDLGGFAMALKYATDCKHVIIGKPEEEYFMSAINDMGLSKDEVCLCSLAVYTKKASPQNPPTPRKLKFPKSTLTSKISNHLDGKLLKKVFVSIAQHNF